MKVLLVEPDYRRCSKSTRERVEQDDANLGWERPDDDSLWYPPLGLMKLSSFHKDRGDEVHFVCGCDKALVGEENRIKLFLKTRFVAVIVDESAKIKSPNSALAQSFHRLSLGFSKRVIMTGTPAANRPYDIWSQIFFLDQGESLGTDFATFKTETDLSADLADNPTRQEAFEARIEGIFRRISSFCVRETKDSGVIVLPEKRFEVIQTDWEPLQYDYYRQIRDELRIVIMRDGALIEDTAESILKRLLRLVQIASNPKLVVHNYSGRPGKFESLESLVQQILDQGEKVIVWTNFTANVDWLRTEFRHFGACRVHGKLGIDVRNKELARFKTDANSKVLIATPGAAKEGLTLTQANHAIFYDRGFSLDDYLQAQDRIHRVSQNKVCYIYNFVMRDSIDEWIDVLIEAKRLAAQLVQGDIDLETYRRKASYDFPTMLAQVLGDGN